VPAMVATGSPLACIRCTSARPGWKVPRRISVWLHGQIDQTRTELVHLVELRESCVQRARPILSSATTPTSSLDTDRPWHSKRVHWPGQG
jgi:hypothetical protein